MLPARRALLAAIEVAGSVLTLVENSVNCIEGEGPPALLQVPKSKLLVSPVEPLFLTQFGAAVPPR